MRAAAGPERSAASAERRLRLALRDVFGFESLRTGQHRVIRRVLAAQSTLEVMPTGAGKSLCYQLPAVLTPKRGCVNPRRSACPRPPSRRRRPSSGVRKRVAPPARERQSASSA
ncbi:MAG: hypothetical protein WKG52_10430 [Variovorax sp.]